jgi:hypothetical protein
LASEKPDSFLHKIQSWRSYIEKNVTDCFLTLYDFLNKCECKLSDSIASDNIIFVRPVSYSERVFSTCGRRFSVVMKPVTFPLTESVILTKQYEELTDISTDMGLKHTYTNAPLISFWAGLKEEFSSIPSIPSYFHLLSRTMLSRYSEEEEEKEKKNRNRLMAEHNMRVQLSTVVPDFRSLVASKQVHPSHQVSTT